MTSMDSQEKLNQLSNIDKSLQHFLAQKQQLQSQLLEIDSALSELSSSSESYKIIGNIMVSAKSEELILELQQKKKLIEIKISSVEKQEVSAQESLKVLQKEIQGD